MNFATRSAQQSRIIAAFRALDLHPRRQQRKCTLFDLLVHVFLKQVPAVQNTAETIFRAGQEGDELALEIFRRMGVYLGIGLANLINILNPEMIVIGGGVAN